MISLAFGLGMAWIVLTMAGRDEESHDLWLGAMREMCQSDLQEGRRSPTGGRALVRCPCGCNALPRQDQVTQRSKTVEKKKKQSGS